MGSSLKKPVRVWNKTAKIRQAIYRVWRFNPRRVEALRMARIGRGSYLCAKCMQVFGPKNVQVDHIDRVSPPGHDPNDWNGFIERLFEGRLQVLCLACHVAKKEHGRPATKQKTSKK